MRKWQEEQSGATGAQEEIGGAFDDIATAHEHMAANANAGKIVVDVAR